MSEQSPAAWYPDPYGRFERRYWDGARWTEHVSSDGHQAVDPMGLDPTTPSADEAQIAPDWYPDPYGRFERRYWDGSRWTDHVHSGQSQLMDPTDQVEHGTSRSPDPGVEQPDVPTIGPVNRKVKRQARKAGAAGDVGPDETLKSAQVLVVNQKAKLIGSTLGYAMYNAAGQQVGTIQELRRDLSTRLSDSLRGRSEMTRVHRFQVVDLDGRVLLAMTRPELGWFQTKATLVVDGPEGTLIGQISQESIGVGGSVATLAHTAFGGIAGLIPESASSGARRLKTTIEGLDKIGHARFGLEAGGRRLGSVHAESTKQWDFNVKDVSGTEIARITKTWAGWTKERFTKADNYVVQMHAPLDDPLRSLVIAAALAIDVELKQFGDQTRGSSLWGTRRYD